jgi:hypothetical protein
MGGGTKKEKATSQFFESGLAKEVDSSVSRWIGNSFAVIGACTEVALEFAKKTTHSIVLHRRKSQCINPRGATIGSDSTPRLPQDVTPIDTVKQRVKSPIRRLLGCSP